LEESEEKELLHAWKNMSISPDDIEDISSPIQKGPLAKLERARSKKP
jgi:hypothetical protein